MKRLLVLLLVCLLSTIQAAHAFDVLTISNSTPFSSIAEQVDARLTRTGSGNPTGVVASPIAGTWYYDFTNGVYYFCSESDGSDTTGGTTWTLYAPGVSHLANSDGTITVSAATGAVVLSIPSNVALPGSPTTTTPSTSDNSTRVATTAFVKASSASTTLTSGHLLVGNGSNVATDTAVTGDLAITNTGATTVATTGGVAFAASATTDTTNATHITSGTLGSSVVLGNGVAASTQSSSDNSTLVATDAFVKTAVGAVPVFAGNGSEGSVSLSGTETSPRQLNASAVTVADSTTYTASPGSILNSTGNFTVGGGSSGILAMALLANGAPTNASTSSGTGGWGPYTTQATAQLSKGSSIAANNTFASGGSGGISSGGAGGGGGWLDGGAGGNYETAGANGVGGTGVHTWMNQMAYTNGGGGGSGSLGSSVSITGGAGGASNAGGLKICVGGNLLINSGASLNVIGGTGSAGTAGPSQNNAGAGGGGGGAGGSLDVYVVGNVTITGVLAADGGMGGAGGNGFGTGLGSSGAGGGGGGGPGRCMVVYGGTLTGAPTANGGAGGSGGTAGTGGGIVGTGGFTGTNGTAITWHRTPSLPLLGMHSEDVDIMCQIGYLKDHGTGLYNFSSANGSSLLCAVETNKWYDHTWAQRLCGKSMTPPSIAFMQLFNRFMTQDDYHGELPVSARFAMTNHIAAEQYANEFTSQTIESDEAGVYAISDYVENVPAV